MNLETSKLEYQISLQNLEEAVEQKLREWGFVKYHQDVKVRFGNVKGPLGDVFSKDCPIPLHLEITSSKEVSEGIAIEEKKLS